MKPVKACIFTCQTAISRILNMPSASPCGTYQHSAVRELGRAKRGGQSEDWILTLALGPNGDWIAAADWAGAVQL
uniref:Uncharacterized protein n=1 Tax=uncultured Planctomycetota bacterium TaxID=120965 RepID=H5SCS7_9BACT|nr:hypothetical protein HGMM_F11F07C35 [uncultured Planctomycetota bacterium]